MFRTRVQNSRSRQHGEQRLGRRLPRRLSGRTRTTTTTLDMAVQLGSAPTSVSARAHGITDPPRSCLLSLARTHARGPAALQQTTNPKLSQSIAQLLKSQSKCKQSDSNAPLGMDSPSWVWLLGVFLVCFRVSNMRFFRVSEKIVLLPCVKHVFRVLLSFFVAVSFVRARRSCSSVCVD